MDEQAAKLLKDVGRDPIHDILLVAILGLILATMVVRWFLERRTDKAPAAVECTSKGEIDQLVALHSQRDSDGVPRWYVKSSMERAIQQTAESVERIERAVNDLVERCKDCDRKRS